MIEDVERQRIKPCEEELRYNEKQQVHNSQRITTTKIIVNMICMIRTREIIHGVLNFSSLFQVAAALGPSQLLGRRMLARWA